MKWALYTKAPSPAAKLVLIALAGCINQKSDKDEAWPSQAELCDVTGLNRKTVIDAIGKLADAELIHDTGKRQGATQQVKVYSLAVNKPMRNGTFNGLLEEAQKGNCSKNGTVPVFPQRVPVFPQRVPKTGHGTGKEQRRNKEGGSHTPCFEPVKRGLYRREYLAMLSDCDAEIKAIRDNEGAYIRTLSKNAEDLIAFLMREKPPDHEKRIREAQDNPESMVKSKLLPEWQEAVTAWQLRKQEIKNAMKGIR